MMNNSTPCLCCLVWERRIYIRAPHFSCLMYEYALYDMVACGYTQVLSFVKEITARASCLVSDYFFLNFHSYDFPFLHIFFTFPSWRFSPFSCLFLHLIYSSLPFYHTFSLFLLCPCVCVSVCSSYVIRKGHNIAYLMSCCYFFKGDK